jgi:hypothetical protein
MENGVYDSCDRACTGGDFRVGFGPDFSKVVIAFPLTFGAWTVSGSQSSGFVEKEEFGILAGCHDAMFPPFEFEQADDPPLPLESTPDPPMRVVQTAPVAQERSACGGGDQRTKWGDTVLSWHLCAVVEVRVGNEKIIDLNTIASSYRFSNKKAAPDRNRF